jgi:hypothetical protein
MIPPATLRTSVVSLLGDLEERAATLGRLAETCAPSLGPAGLASLLWAAERACQLLDAAQAAVRVPRGQEITALPKS